MTALQSIHPVVVADHGYPTTSSTNVAAVFGKEHRNVMRAIDNLNIPSKWRVLNFEQTVISRPNPSGGSPIESPAYNMTKDGFTVLVMGFTGKKAMEFKLAYIDAFNAMESRLRLPAYADSGDRCTINVLGDSANLLSSVSSTLEKLQEVVRQVICRQKEDIKAITARMDTEKNDRLLEEAKLPPCPRGYYTVTELAACLGMTAGAAYDKLIEVGVLVRGYRGRYVLAQEHAHHGHVFAYGGSRTSLRVWEKSGRWILAALTVTPGEFDV